MSRWHRLAHMRAQPLVTVGQYIEAGKTIVGNVGATGHVTGPHVHHDGTLAKPVRWQEYTSRPLREYFDTQPWAHIVLPYEHRYLTNWHGKNGHIGVDINVAPQDLGLPIYSPVNGRVQYVEPTYSVRQILNGLARLVDKTWGGGFGHFIWIEEDMARPSI